jgi:hypothetical protein
VKNVHGINKRCLAVKTVSRLLANLIQKVVKRYAEDKNLEDLTKHVSKTQFFLNMCNDLLNSYNTCSRC